MMLLALPQPGPPRLTAFAGLGLQAEHRAEREPQHAGPADAQQVAAGHPASRRSQRSLPGCPGMTSMTSGLLRRLAIEQKRRAVDQGPGQILGERQPGVLQLLALSSTSCRKLGQASGSTGSGLLTSASLSRSCLSLRVDRARLLGFGHSVCCSLLQFGVQAAVVLQQLGLLLVGSLVGRDGQDIGDVLGQAVERDGRGEVGHRNAEPADRVLAVLVLLVQLERQQAGAVSRRSAGFEHRRAILARLRGRGPAVVRSAAFLPSMAVFTS